MANKNKGWISIYRSICDHWVWKKDKVYDHAHAWIDLLLDANHEDRKIVINGKLTVIHRGQKWTSTRTLAKRWGWGKDRVDRFLKLLESDEMLRMECTKNGTLLTLVNYDNFQGQCDTNETPSRHGRDSNETRSRQNNNYNNENNENNVISLRRFTPPTRSEIVSYCLESGHKIDADAFIDFYSSKNWMVGKNKMKDWKAAVRNWERHDKEKSGPTPKPKQYSNFQNFQPSGMDWNEAFDQIMYNQ